MDNAYPILAAIGFLTAFAGFVLYVNRPTKGTLAIIGTGVAAVVVSMSVAMNFDSSSCERISKSLSSAEVGKPGSAYEIVKAYAPTEIKNEISSDSVFLPEESDGVKRVPPVRFADAVFLPESKSCAVRFVQDSYGQKQPVATSEEPTDYSYEKTGEREYVATIWNWNKFKSVLSWYDARAGKASKEYDAVRNSGNR